MKVHKFVTTSTPMYEAVLVDSTNIAEVAEWCGARSYWSGPKCPTPGVWVPQPDGPERFADVGDWVMRYPFRYIADQFQVVQSNRLAQRYQELA